MIKIQNNTATREPVPTFLVGLATESLLDLSWTDPALGVSDCAWWPEELAEQTLDLGTHRYGDEILTPDTARRVVIVTREIVPLTADEIAGLIAVRRAAILAEADHIAKVKRDQVTAAISPAEMASWPIKRAEAIAYQSTGTATDAPNLALEATARGIPLADLATKVMAKAAILSQIEAAIAGRCGAIQDAASAATTLAELSVIDPAAGWPV